MDYKNLQSVGISINFKIKVEIIFLKMSLHKNIKGFIKREIHL